MAPYKPQTTFYYTGAPSLVDMAQRAAMRNISRLYDVGDIPYKLVAPILKRIDNPDQLQQIEDASPHIADHSAELWKAFIAREIPSWREKMIEPKNPRSWGKVYRKLKREEQRRLEAQEEELRAKMEGINKRREENKTTYVEKVLPESRGRQKAFVDGRRNPHGQSSGMDASGKRSEGPSLKNAKTGKDFFNALRKPTSNTARFSKPGVIPPMLPSAKSQIPRPPESMVREVPKPASGPPSQRASVTQRSSTPLDNAALEARKAEQRKKEERLRALANGSSTSTARSPPLTPPKSNTITSAPSAPKESNSPVEALSPTHLETPRDALKKAAHVMRRPSPSPTPPLQRKRPATPASVFMPTPKKRKV